MANWATERSATLQCVIEVAASAKIFRPEHLRRPCAPWVSYYALFHGWLPPSLPPQRLCTKTIFCSLRNLSLGPYRTIWAVSLLTVDLSAHGLPDKRAAVIQSSKCVGIEINDPSQLCGFTNSSYKRSDYLNSFRRQPAITQLDWSFAPTHKSSQTFATVTGSDLHVPRRTLHLAHA